MKSTLAQFEALFKNFKTCWIHGGIKVVLSFFSIYQNMFYFPAGEGQLEVGALYLSYCP